MLGMSSSGAVLVVEYVTPNWEVSRTIKAPPATNQGAGFGGMTWHLLMHSSDSPESFRTAHIVVAGLWMAVSSLADVASVWLYQRSTATSTDFAFFQQLVGPSSSGFGSFGISFASLGQSLGGQTCGTGCLGGCLFVPSLRANGGFDSFTVWLH
jgi:hypothetical protein